MFEGKTDKEIAGDKLARAVHVHLDALSTFTKSGGESAACRSLAAQKKLVEALAIYQATPYERARQEREEARKKFAAQYEPKIVGYDPAPHPRYEDRSKPQEAMMKAAATILAEALGFELTPMAPRYVPVAIKMPEYSDVPAEMITEMMTASVLLQSHFNQDPVRAAASAASVDMQKLRLFCEWLKNYCDEVAQHRQQARIDEAKRQRNL